MKIANFALAAIAAATLAACGNSQQSAGQDASATTPAASGKVVRIGSANPLTGPFAHWGRDADNGVKLAVDEANAEGVTLNGEKATFEVVSEDDQADPKTATQVAQRFLDNGVVAVVGHLTSGAAIPASRIYSDAGIPMVAGSVTSPKFTQQGYNNTFRIIANDLQQGQALAKFAVSELKMKNIAIIDDRTTYGQGLADDFAKAVEAAGGTIVKREYTTNTATDFMAILTSLKAAKPELLFYGGMDAQAGPLVKQMRKLGMTTRFMGADGVNTAEFAKLAGTAAEGAYASSAGASKELMPGFAAFNDKYKAKFGSEIQAYAPYTYDAAKVLIDAMKRAGSADPKKFLPEISKTQLQGVTGPIAFESNGDVKNGTVTLYQLQGGTWKGVIPAANVAASAAQ
ncbi:branched-chain amino acid ABC transporter substrate-binding protein [Vogesella oryzae]|uniref:branched-chain amino acid ABC transporter substrate-binding protein n=1 Tax=Vogesella oryzae TaxID=1735285 RepID=UPI001583AC45|nr:branched-chain amino acid ABC transporter substrate-binding protein [Vogesella oryzae]